MQVCHITTAINKSEATCICTHNSIPNNTIPQKPHLQTLLSSLRGKEGAWLDGAQGVSQAPLPPGSPLTPLHPPHRQRHVPLRQQVSVN